MRVLIQRVSASQVTVGTEVVGSIGKGLTLLVGIAPTDTEAELQWMAKKCLTLRLFPEGEAGRFDRSVTDIDGELLVVSQFTLYGDGQKGRRPSFSKAAPPDQAARLYDAFICELEQSGLKVETGIFGATMQVSIENDGPVTLWLTRESTHSTRLD
ncbi:MAG: D-aminoacyl-tRNA deacylase [Cyanobacteria bacterium J06614_10]